MRNASGTKISSFSSNHLLLMKMFEYKHFINKINEPHNRNLLFNSILLNTQKHNEKIISKI